ncbi:MAG: penicillin-binding protein 2 [Dehalococcoidia bacterium]|nr:penicillin-binding protein 2 [Dehalococcoidia bacterium]
MGLLTNNRRRRWRVENTEQADPKERLKLKLNLLKLVVLIAFVALSVQLARLQLVDGRTFERRAQLNQLRIEPVIPARGIIYDRNGVPVVQNVPSFSAAIVPADLPRSRTLEIAAGLQRLLGVPALETTLKVEQARRSNNPFTPVIIKDGLDQQAAFRTREELSKLPGVQIIVEPVRKYTTGPLLADVLGFTGRIDQQEYATLKNSGYIASDRLGKSGVEYTYEQYLRGTPGRQEIEKDASGRAIRTLAEDQPKAGDDVMLSIDLDLQKKTTEILQKAANGGQAAAVVMDVRTGEVLAMVSLPQYDDNVFSGTVDEAKLNQYLNDPNKPLVNQAIGAQNAPGSIFKQITGTAALQEGVATANTMITSNGYITVPNDYDPSILYTFKDWRVLGPLNFYAGVAWSSDVYFYYLAGGYHWYGQNFNGLGPDRLALYARAYGLGSKTGIDLPGEVAGNIPDPAWKKQTFGDVWTLGDTYNMAIGQGFVTASPIQMLRVTAAVANGGTLLVPRVVREVRDAQGHVVVPNTPQVARQLPISAANFAIMRQGMIDAVAWGSATPANLKDDLQIAGKTGTAEYGVRGPGDTSATHAWFSGFAPAQNPQLAVTVFLQNGVGATNAAPVGAQILSYYFHRPQQQAAAAAPPLGQAQP